MGHPRLCLDPRLRNLRARTNAPFSGCLRDWAQLPLDGFRVVETEPRIHPPPPNSRVQDLLQSAKEDAQLLLADYPTLAQSPVQVV